MCYCLFSAFFVFVKLRFVFVVITEEIACADPAKCLEICGNPSGCTNIAYPLLVMRILPAGKKKN